MPRRPTRRDVLGTGALVGAGLLAGCTGDAGTESGGDPTETPAGEPTATEATAETETETPTEDPSYTVNISPMGDVTFDAVPENAMVYSGHYADMAVAFGHGDSINSLGFPEFFYEGFYDELPAVEFDKTGLTRLFNDGLDKELFYELDSDVHFMDPTWVLNVSAFGLDEADVEEIRENVGPWFGNRYSRAHSDPGVEEYEYYTAWELYGKVAQVYREEERYDALKAVRDELVAELKSNLPPESERPTVGLINYNPEEKTFSPYKIANDGFGVSHYRPLGIRDVFADSDRTYEQNYEATYDLEGMLEFDPDVLIENFSTGGSDAYDAMLELENDPVGKELTAVQNDRLYPGGSSLQGPIYNVFQLEMAAKQVYPEQFGEWRDFGEDGSYPDFGEDERLFDRERVNAIIAGEF